MALFKKNIISEDSCNSWQKTFIEQMTDSHIIKTINEPKHRL